ncbi:restriction endonuclease subunit S [Limosilactobacillus reuteri]|uniref:restriction endonuclease subunit S n=1 Tax=Limosilactobacillus reuteri TaxID=1598 RepID=UPI0039926213
MGELGSVQMNKRIFKNQTSESGDVPFYKIGTFGKKADAYISNSLYQDYKEKYPYPNKGDLLISASGSIGRIVEYKGQKAYYQDSNIVWLEHNNHVLNSFLKAFYQIVKWDGTEGSTIKRLYNKNILNTKIKLPKVKEQKVLGTLISTVDLLISLQQRKLEQLKQLKKAMLQQLFVDKNNKQPNSRFKNFKGNWEQHRLEEVAQVTMGQSPSSKNYTDNPNDYVLVQGNADLKSNKISPRVWTKEITKQVHKGEIIMTVRAPVGYLAMANMDAVIGRGVAAIDGNKYLYYLLQTKLMDRTWEKLSSGSTFESISSNDIKNLEIKVTETEEEKLITKLMNTVTYFVTLQKNNLTQLTTLKKYLLQNLFI